MVLSLLRASSLGISKIRETRICIAVVGDHRNASDCKREGRPQSGSRPPVSIALRPMWENVDDRGGKTNRVRRLFMASRSQRALALDINRRGRMTSRNAQRPVHAAGPSPSEYSPQISSKLDHSAPSILRRSNVRKNVAGMLRPSMNAGRPPTPSPEGQARGRTFDG